MRVIDAHGNVALSESVRFDELPGGDTPSSKDFESVQCRPINGDPPPGRLRLASLTMAAVGLGLVCCVFCIACAVAVFVYKKIKNKGDRLSVTKRIKGNSSVVPGTLRAVWKYKFMFSKLCLISVTFSCL